MNRPKTLGQCVGDFRTVFEQSGDWFFGLSNCPSMPFLCVRVKMNNGVGYLALRGMFGCVLNHGKLPYCGSTH